MNHESPSFWTMLPEWLTAIGTLLAVVVALYLSRRDRIIRCIADAHVGVIIGTGQSVAPEYVVLTVTNIGTRSFVLTGMTWRMGIFKKTYGDIVPPQNSISDNLPMKLKDGEQASWRIPLEAFRANSVPVLLERMPKILPSAWLWFMRLIVNTTSGKLFIFKVGKHLRKDILDTHRNGSRA